MQKTSVKTYREGMEKYATEHQKRVTELQKAIEEFKGKHAEGVKRIRDMIPPLVERIKTYVREFWG